MVCLQYTVHDTSNSHVKKFKRVEDRGITELTKKYRCDPVPLYVITNNSRIQVHGIISIKYDIVR